MMKFHYYFRLYESFIVDEESVFQGSLYFITRKELTYWLIRA
jgi:hypothetical protein